MKIKNKVVFTFSLLAVFTLSFCLWPGVSKKDKPNIIIILSDDQGWGDFSFTGNSNIQTPNIDMLAKEGAFFERFYVSPVCSPTRAELLTGRYHLRMGVHGTSEGGERMDTDEVTLAEVFKNAGYSTGAFGKWHNGTQYPYHPNGRGFEEYYGFCSGHWGNYFSPMLEHNGALTTGEGYLTDDFTNKALDFIDENKDNPFLLYVAYNTPHSPMQVPDEWWNKYKDKDLRLFAESQYEEDTLFTKAALAMCANIDWNVGRILEKLKTDDLDQNTIVIYFTDNGPNSWRWNGGLKGRKGSVDEGGVRSPLFIRFPGIIDPGTRIKSIAGAIDILPTLTDFAGIENSMSKPLDGQSLVPTLLNDKEDKSDRFIFSHWNGRRSVRNQEFLYTHQGELYHLLNDPGQSEDISDKYSEVKTGLARALKEWEEEVSMKAVKDNSRSFPIGHPEFRITQLPARDGIGHGNIIRSDNSPNCTYYTNWIDLDDKITWDVEILQSGDFEVALYYTCSEADKGSKIALSMGENILVHTINIAHDPPLKGMENDRIPRTQSYVKDFRKLEMGTIHLDKGSGVLQLKALTIPGKSVLDLRLLILKRVGPNG